MEQEILFDEHDNEQSERYKAAKKSTWVSVFVNCILLWDRFWLVLSPVRKV